MGWNAPLGVAAYSFFKSLSSQRSLVFTAKLQGRYGDYSQTLSLPMYSLSHYQHPPPERYIGHSWLTYTGHTIITQNPQFTSEFTLGVVHSKGLNNHVSMTVSYRIYSLPWKSSVLFLLISSFPITLGNHWSFSCLRNFAFSRISL